MLIRSLPVERWTKSQAAIAFLAIGVHLGNLRMQNAEGHLLGHVRDLDDRAMIRIRVSTKRANGKRITQIRAMS